MMVNQRSMRRESLHNENNTSFVTFNKQFNKNVSEVTLLSCQNTIFFCVYMGRFFFKCYTLKTQRLKDKQRCHPNHSKFYVHIIW